MSDQTAINLVRLAVKVRAAQRRYFRERTKEALAESKALEARFDREAAALLATIDPPQPGDQGAMF